MTPTQPIALAVRNPRSIGIARYVSRLEEAFAARGERYEVAAVPRSGRLAHFHLANSSRRVVGQAFRCERPYAVTVHDVVPRTPALGPFYRAVVYPFCVRRAARVIVHSDFAATMLADVAGVPPAAIKVIPIPATSYPVPLDAGEAKVRLGLDRDGPPLFVLPGVIKKAKLVGETLAAATPLISAGAARLLLVGRIAEQEMAREAHRAGAVILERPDNALYDMAILAADCVLTLRTGTVGESNGPLMDAIGAGRAVLATPTGSIPEAAGDAAVYVEAATGQAIAERMHELLDSSLRDRLASSAARRATELTWSASAASHASVFAELACR